MSNVRDLPCKYDFPMTGLDWLQYYSEHKVFHPAIDFNEGIGDQDCGNEVRAPREGELVFVNNTPSAGRGFGKFIIMKHSDGSYTRYAHLADTAYTPIQKGAKIEYKELLGHVGKTGTKYCHCHFEAFGEAMAEYQRQHKYSWCYYPVGRPRAWVEQHYINPWEWLKQEQGIEDPKRWEWPVNILPKISLDIYPEVVKQPTSKTCVHAVVVNQIEVTRYFSKAVLPVSVYRLREEELRLRNLPVSFQGSASFDEVYKGAVALRYIADWSRVQTKERDWKIWLSRKLPVATHIGTHAVLVLGYSENGWLYIDPLSGKRKQQSDITKFGSSYIVRL